MNTNLLIIFIVLNVINVILQTVKSICTVKCGKVVASLVNAITFGVYTIVLIYMVCDLPLFTKAIIVALCNLVGVYVVKVIEEKMRKDKLWLVKVTMPYGDNAILFANTLINSNISYTTLSTSGDYVVFDTYCNTQKETQIVLDNVKAYGGKCFATENKLA